MKNSLLKSSFFIVINLMCWSNTARSEMIFGLYGGYSFGTLKRTSSEKFQTVSTMGTVGYNLRGFNVHGFFESMDLAYKVGDSSYDGIYALSGVGFGYQIGLSKAFNWKFSLQKALSGTYVVLSESTGTVKDTEYKHSELTTLQGGNAYHLITGVEMLMAGSGSSKRKGENIYTGLQLGYLRQDFETQTTRFKTNNSVVAPLSSGAEPVSYSVTIMTLFLTVHYDI